jgi:hypothetical protein
MVKEALTLKASIVSNCNKQWSKIWFDLFITGQLRGDNFVWMHCMSSRELYAITLHTTKESTIERDDLADVFSAEHYMTCFLSYAQFKSKTKTKT